MCYQNRTTAKAIDSWVTSKLILAHTNFLNSSASRRAFFTCARYFGLVTRRIVVAQSLIVGWPIGARDILSRVDNAFGLPGLLIWHGSKGIISCAAASKGSTIATSPEELIRRPQRETAGG